MTKRYINVYRAEDLGSYVYGSPFGSPLFADEVVKRMKEANNWTLLYRIVVTLK